MDAIEAVSNTLRVQQAFRVLAVTLALTAYLYPTSDRVLDYEEYDFIVVGGGTAGIVVAARLTECGQFNVMLIEAGGEPPSETMLPALYSFLPQTVVDWNYTARNYNSAQCHRTGIINMTSAKVLGGGSSINAMAYVRGCPGDYRHWARAAGDPTWDWNGVFPYFIKNEALQDDDILRTPYRAYHGTHGWLGVSSQKNKDFSKYFEAFRSVGNPVVFDINGEQTLGYTQQLYTVANGIRQSTAYALLSKIKDRPNLHVLTNAFVTEIMFDGENNANGVKVVTEDKQTVTLLAKLEVILSAGTIRSPQLLMLSGIGPREHLDSFNIKVRSDLPVGFNYQNHVTLFMLIQLEKSRELPPPTNPHQPGNSFTGYVSLNKHEKCPSYQSYNTIMSSGSKSPMNLCAFKLGLDYNLCQTLYEAGKGWRTLFTIINLLHPKSKGIIQLNSLDPFEQPYWDTGMLSDDEDIEELVDTILDYKRVLASPYFKSINATMVNLNLCNCKAFEYESRSYWRCYVLCLTTSTHHFSGTCSLGLVVDSRLRVFGVGKLRVVDASIIPHLPSGNTNAAVIMVAEKAADFIKKDYNCSYLNQDHKKTFRYSLLDFR